MDCQHTITRNDICSKCGEIIFTIETRPCCECASFIKHELVGTCRDRLMGVPNNMKVYYKVSEGSCFKVKEEKPAKIKFEVGKFYRHTSGHEISIICKASTTMFGKTLIAEQNESIEFIAVGCDEASAENYIEITKEEWMRRFK